MTAHAPGPWVIDNRSGYEGQHGKGCAPVSLGAVVAECPTAFSGHTIRAPHTIGKPCPTKDAMDAEGLANAHLVKAAPDPLACCKGIIAARAEEFATPITLDEIRAAIAKAEGRP